MNAIIDNIKIHSKIINAAKERQFVGIARQAARTKLLFAKENLMENIDNHDVTQELLQDPSQEGSQLVDHGNLVSFLGLPDGEEEVAKLKEFLRESIDIEEEPIITSNKSSINYGFPVNVPEISEIDEALPSPDNWSSRGIISLIEKGVGNAANYIFAISEAIAKKFADAGSRSGYGLQSKHTRKAGGSFTAKDYISGILKNFIKDIK
jgi:hypothetical protein